VRLLEHPNAQLHDITALVRSPEKALKLKESFGVESVVGSLEDFHLVVKLASESDVAVSCADSDHVKGTEAILIGLKKRFEATGTPPVLIHTSGTGVLMDYALGMHSNHTVYSDADADQLETLAPTQMHRNVDLMILDADQEGYCKSYIVLPSTIYGMPTGRLVDAGIQHKHSVQVPAIIRASLARGQGGMVGPGLNVWHHVHIDDTVDLYIILYDSIMSDPHTGHGRDGFYIGENGEYSMVQLAKTFSEAFVELGLGTDPEPKSFTPEENSKFFGALWPFLGTNSRCRADRSRSIGWKPTKTTEDFYRSIKPEIVALTQK